MFKKQKQIISVICSLIVGSAPLFAVVQPKLQPVYRTEGDLAFTKVNPQGTHLAFTNSQGHKLRILDLKTGDIFQASEQKVGDSFFWSPSGHRLFFREMYQQENKPVSAIFAYDLQQKNSHLIETLAGFSGFITFDPRDLRYALLHDNGIRLGRLDYPGQRLAKWQTAQRVQNGRWIATPKKIMWLSDGGYSMQAMIDDQSGIASFDLSPDGRSIVWATQKGQIYQAKDGKRRAVVIPGLDPSWHPMQAEFVYVKPDYRGTALLGYDLAVADSRGQTRRLRFTPQARERWPRWMPNGQQILYTIEKSTDLFVVEFE